MDRSKTKTAGKDFKGGIKTSRVKSGTKKKSKNVNRNKQGGMAGTGLSPDWKPFMR